MKKLTTAQLTTENEARKAETALLNERLRVVEAAIKPVETPPPYPDSPPTPIDRNVVSIYFTVSERGEMQVGTKRELTAIGKNSKGEIVRDAVFRFESRNEKIASITVKNKNSATVEAVGAGETSLACYAENGNHEVMPLTVKPIDIPPDKEPDIPIDPDRKPPIEINPKTIQASDFPAPTVAQAIEKALNVLDKGTGGEVIADGNLFPKGRLVLDRNTLIGERQKVTLKNGLFESETTGLPSGRSSVFFLDHNSKLFGENATIQENLAPDASGNESPYNLILAYRAHLYEANRWGIPYTGVTRNIEVNGLKLVGHKENPFDGGGNAAIYLGNAHDSKVRNIEADGIHSYIAEKGGFGWLATTAKNILFENIKGKHIATQNMATILCDGGLIKNLHLSEPGTPPYAFADIRPSANGGIVIELAENCHVRDGSGIEIRDVQGISGINDSWQVGKINRRTYELLGRTDGNGIPIKNTRPTFNGGWSVGSGIAIGAVVTFQGYDYEPNGGGITIPFRDKIREKIMAENPQYTQSFWDGLDYWGWYAFEIARWNITKTEITEADMSERLIDLVMEDCTFDFRNQYSPSGGAIAFQATNFDILNYGNKFRRIKIFGDLRGKTTVGMQMSKFTTDLEVDDMEINNCSSGFVASGDKIKVNNLRMEGCGRGGNSALELLDCTNSEFSNIRMDTGTRGNPRIEDSGAGNSNNKFREIYADGVKIR